MTNAKMFGNTPAIRFDAKLWVPASTLQNKTDVPEHKQFLFGLTCASNAIKVNDVGLNSKCSQASIIDKSAGAGITLAIAENILAACRGSIIDIATTSGSPI
jgi:hypothetical protein